MKFYIVMALSVLISCGGGESEKVIPTLKITSKLGQGSLEMGQIAKAKLSLEQTKEYSQILLESYRDILLDSGLELQIISVEHPSLFGLSSRVSEGSIYIIIPSMLNTAQIRKEFCIELYRELFDTPTFKIEECLAL